MAGGLAAIVFAPLGLAAGVPQNVDMRADGRVVVTNTGVEPSGTDDDLRLVEEMRLGGIFGDGPDIFGDISDIAVADDGRIFVLDTGAQEVRVFGDDGRYLRGMARDGEGPGELHYLPGSENGGMRVVLHEPNRLWIGSALQHLVLDSLGNEVARAPLRVPWYVEGEFITRERVVGSDERFVYQDVSVGAKRTEDDLDYPRYNYAVRLPRPVDGETVYGPGDSLRIETRRINVSPPAIRSVPGRGQAMVSMSEASPRQFAWTVGGGNVWLAHRSAYRFHEVTFAGDTIRTVELGDPPPSPPLTEVLDAAELNPRIAALHVSPEGWLWVAREGEEDEGSSWDLFDNCGRYRGAVGAPDRLWALSLGARGEVYGVVSDAFDVDYVLRLRLEGADGTRVTMETCTF
ncbi:6-bladed beta-propeller [Candidatus Palauibacter sp.]|uniref:6-bladed beta-propeller n=1 Tax=Candidatus Palauibacter sp. TaxID=3101350 RepID=UPI003B52D3A6